MVVNIENHLLVMTARHGIYHNYHIADNNYTEYCAKCKTRICGLECCQTCLCHKGVFHFCDVCVNDAETKLQNLFENEIATLLK